MVDVISIFDVRYLFKQRGDIRTGLQAISFGSFNQTVKHGAGLCTATGVGEQPVFPADNEGFDCAFSTIIINDDYAMLEVNLQFSPLIKRVANRATNGCFGRHLQRCLIQPSFELLHN